MDIDELELELIDAGLEEIFVEANEAGEDEAVIHAGFEDFGNMQKALEEKGIELKQAKLERIPLSYKEVNEEQIIDVTKLLDKLEEDEDVQAVYHNMAE
jgi:transcriptional/translational regulatory protein YebC/TACO1